MKKNLTRITSLLLVFCLMFLSACEMPGNKAPETPEEFWARPHEWYSESLGYNIASNENGYYFLEECNLTYFDYATKEKVILCNKVNCRHDNTSCEACFMSNLFMFFREKSLYLITDDDEGMHIFQCDLDATNRQSKILLMKDEMEKGNAVGVGSIFVNGDNLFYTAGYQEPSDDSGEKKPPIKAVRYVNLKTWTDEEICRSVENEYRITAIENDGVLFMERPDVTVVSKVDVNIFGEEEKKKGIVVLTKEEEKQFPVNIYYWDKKTGDKLNLYESNYADTYYAAFAEENYIYMMCTPEDVNTIALEKIDMRTGESECLWKEKAGKGSFLLNCGIVNNHVYLTVSDPDGICYDEIYEKDDFKEITPPFLNGNDNIFIENEHGYIVDKMIEHRPDNQYGDFIDMIFIPTEEADKENPEYIVIKSHRDD